MGSQRASKSGVFCDEWWYSDGSGNRDMGSKLTSYHSTYAEDSKVVGGCDIIDIWIGSVPSGAGLMLSHFSMSGVNHVFGSPQLLEISYGFEL